MSVKNIQIIFDHPTAVYMTGDIITGRVIIFVNSDIKIRKVKLKFKGECSVLWREHSPIYRRNSRPNITNRKYSFTHNKTKTERFTAKEEYFNHNIILAGGEGKLNLKEGEHVYPFSFSLPEDLPSTFEDEYGSIQYIAKVVINIPWDMKQGKEIMFEVISPLNLNDEPSLAEPKIQEKEKKYCCCCCKSGPMTMIVYIPYTGFVPGQFIPVTIELDNHSNVDVDSIKIKLERILRFKARFPNSKIKSKWFKIVDVCINGIEKHASNTRTEQIKIPNSLIIPNLKHCGIITDSYFLNVEACVNGGHISAVTSTSITLGDIPLTIVNDDTPQFDYTFEKSSSQNFSSKEVLLKNSISTNDKMHIPGYAQLVTPYDQQCPLPSNNDGINPELNSLFHIQLSAYPDPQSTSASHNFSNSEIAPDVSISSIKNGQIILNLTKI